MKKQIYFYSKNLKYHQNEKMYSRNRIYIKPDEQEKIKHFRVLLGGAGLGSVIAECALRLGFETGNFHPCFNSEAGMDEGNHSSL